MNKIRHILGLSGGKDSTALAIYLKQKYPELNIEYYFCDTGEELKETYQYIKNLEVFLGKAVIKLKAVNNSLKSSFEHFLMLHGGYLPSSNARWCTRMLKLKPFEKFIGDDKVISYVGIRDDEERDGYISKKKNIQSIFPFRKNIWSNEIINNFLLNDNIKNSLLLCDNNENNNQNFIKILKKQISLNYTLNQKHHELMTTNIPLFNKIVFNYLKTQDYPLSYIENYPLLNKEEGLAKEDIINILQSSGIGMPGYYKKIPYNINGKRGYYARTRSGCYFCFFQQKIEWIWLYEQHPQLYKKAMKFENDNFTWIQNETLFDLIKPDRIKEIKLKHYNKTSLTKNNKNSQYLIDIIADNKDVGCAICTL